jgi:hypothetical protein
MTCKHGRFDPNCSSYQSSMDNLKKDYEKQILGSITPDAGRFNIEDIEEVGNFLVVKASYPNCKSCTFEGMKVMVFAMRNVKDAIKWKMVDPHFRQKSKQVLKNEAPSPIARFPADQEGWDDAIAYARMKSGK